MPFKEYHMKRLHFMAPLAALLVLALVFSAGCKLDSDDDVTYPATLENAVYGGLNPMNAWVTVTFAAKNEAVVAFTHDNSSGIRSYTYDPASGAGSIGSGIGDFSLNSSGDTLTFTNFFGHGNAKVFSRLRKTDLELEPGPEGLSALSSNLNGAVFGGLTPRSGGYGNRYFITITFRPTRKGPANYSGYEDNLTGATVAVISLSGDNTTHVWDYTYNSGALTGTISATGYKPDGSTESWSPKSFSISADGKTLTCADIPYMAGTTFVLNRYK
jgi:hypothetical protein